MNAELKAMLRTLFDLVKVIEHAVAKDDFVSVLLPDLYRLASDVPGIVSNWNDLLPELKALSGKEEDADLLAFVLAQLSSVTSNEKAVKVLSSALKLALCVGENTADLVKALKS